MAGRQAEPSQTDNSRLLGVWNADLPKSKMAGPPATGYVLLIEQKEFVIDRKTGVKGIEVDETSGIKGQRGEQRSVLQFLPNGKAAFRAYSGVPNRITAEWQGNTLSLIAETAGAPNVMKRTYVISPDGQTMTLDIDQIREAGPEVKSSITSTKRLTQRPIAFVLRKRLRRSISRT